jgi:hypothetical protein
MRKGLRARRAVCLGVFCAVAVGLAWAGVSGCSGDGGFRWPGWGGNPSDDLVERVRARLPDLKPGMTEAQVDELLKDLPLGEGVIVSRTISGGKTVQYELAPKQFLTLDYLPNGYGPGPERWPSTLRLTQAALTDE